MRFLCTLFVFLLVASSFVVASSLSKRDVREFINDVDVAWLLTSSQRIFLLIVGLGMLEVGSMPVNSSKRLLFKKLMDACVAGIVFFLFGYAFSFGSGNFFLGYHSFLLMDVDGLDLFFYVWVVAVLTATIVSGGTAGRSTLLGHVVQSVVLTSLVEPFVLHWLWSDDGWLSPWNSDDSTRVGHSGAIDGGGGAVVHVVAGIVALQGALVLGPRATRYGQGTKVVPQPGHSPMFAALGGLLAWFGYFGLANASARGLTMGRAAVVGRISVAVAIGPAASALLVAGIAWALRRPPSLGLVLQSALAGLVSVSAGCAVMEIWALVLVALTAGILSRVVAFVLPRLRVYRWYVWKIDDPLDTFATHWVAGAWGLLSVGLFATKDNIEQLYGRSTQAYGLFYGGGFEQLGVQFLALVSVTVWAGSISLFPFLVLHACRLFRLSKRVENEIGAPGDYHMTQVLLLMAEEDEKRLAADSTASEDIDDLVRAYAEESDSDSSEQYLVRRKVTSSQE